MEKKPKYASLVDTITKSLYAVLVVNALLIALLNISILTNSIPAGSALLFTQTGPGVRNKINTAAVFQVDDDFVFTNNGTRLFQELGNVFSF